MDQIYISSGIGTFDVKEFNAGIIKCGVNMEQTSAMVRGAGDRFMVLLSV